jgi:4a-hydroxytetrahydrobiopterin dehydratase
MERPILVNEVQLATWLKTHPGWEYKDEQLSKEFQFSTYPSGIAFVVQVGFAAESKDHHPNMNLGYRKVRVSWSTHEPKGITSWDLELAEHCDQLVQL